MNLIAPATLVATLAMTANLAAQDNTSPPPKAPGNEKYGLEDLRALAEQETWPELLGHLNDITPRLRKKEWKDLLNQAAIGFVDSIASLDDKYGAMMTAESFLVQYPMLKKSKSYMSKRGEVGLEAFEQCYSNRYGSLQCAERMWGFVQADPQNYELAFEAGKMTRLRGSPQFAMYMFEAAFKKKGKPQWCDEDQLSLAVNHNLGNSPGKAADAAKAVAFKACYKQLKPKLVQWLTEETGYYPKNACKDLTKKKALSKFQSAYCKDQLK